jgi:hypothetical protein
VLGTINYNDVKDTIILKENCPAIVSHETKYTRLDQQKRLDLLSKRNIYLMPPYKTNRNKIKFHSINSVFCTFAQNIDEDFIYFNEIKSTDNFWIGDMKFDKSEISANDSIKNIDVSTYMDIDLIDRTITFSDKDCCLKVWNKITNSD